MGQQKKLVLFDIDHTLFDTRSYLTLSFHRLFQQLDHADLDEFLGICSDIYNKQRENGVFRVENFITSLLLQLHVNYDKEALERVFREKDIIQQSLYPDVETELATLSKLPDVKLGIFSVGVVSMQRAKINSLMQIFTEDHIYISEVDKIRDIPAMIQKYEQDQIYVVDDLLDVLYGFKSMKASIITILMQRGDWHTRNIAKNKDFQPDYTIQTLQKLKEIIV